MTFREIIYMTSYNMTFRDMILHEITQNDIVLHYIGLEEKEMWAGNMNACECFHTPPCTRFLIGRVL